jgi:hypothetical protein
MRTLLIAVGSSCVVAVAIAASASASVNRNCAAVATPVGLTSKVHATNVNCTTARKVAKAFALHGKVTGWKCSAKPFEGGADETCKRTTPAGVHQAVRFQLGD